MLSKISIRIFLLLLVFAVIQFITGIYLFRIYDDSTNASSALENLNSINNSFGIVKSSEYRFVQEETKNPNYYISMQSDHFDASMDESAHISSLIRDLSAILKKDQALAVKTYGFESLIGEHRDVFTRLKSRLDDLGY